jgi:hypothetical protein
MRQAVQVVAVLPVGCLGRGRVKFVLDGLIWPPDGNLGGGDGVLL